MADELDVLRQRIRDLEVIERDYVQLKSLVASAEKGQHLPDAIGNIVLYVDPASHLIVEANESSADFLGFSVDQLRRLSIDALEVHDHATDENIAIYTETSLQEQIYTCSYRHHDGFLLPVHVRKRLIKKDSADILYYLLDERSLSKRVWHELKRREQADYQFQQKLKTLNEINFDLNHIDSFDDLCWHGVKLGVERLGFSRLSLWFLDKKKNVMTGSYGIDEQGSIRDERQQSWAFDGTHVIDFLAGKTDPVITYDEAPLYNDKSQILTHQGWHISVPMLNGEEFIGFMAADNFHSKQPMLNYEPELLRLYGITIGHLAALTRARNQTLELRLEQERARMLKTFITDVGHDFRTPLAVINTNTYLLQRVKDEEKKKSLANTIHEQAMYITQMINDMLNIVKLEYELQLDITAVDLKAQVLAVVQTHDPMAAEKQIQWQLELHDNVVVQADMPYLEQALGGIVKNAIQYTPAGGHITLSLQSYEDTVGIRVQDDGIGIEAQHLDKIFKPLYRVNEARTNRGSGLGLSIAKAITEAHHGHLTVESVLGEGTTFELVLPMHL
jgi:signal transduction histidine kinase